MFDEKDLENMKRTIDETPVPDQISKHIRIEMQRGREKRRKNRRSLFASLAVTFMMMAFLISIRVSPVFASYISTIPGFEKIVQLVNYDKGLSLAVENDFLQPIGISDEHEGIKLTIDHLIIDEGRMVLIYSLENHSEYEHINIEMPRIYHQNNQPFAVGISYGALGEEKVKGEALQGQIDITFSEGEEIPDTIVFETKIRVGEGYPYDQLDSTWNISIPVERDKFIGLKEVYPLNKEVEIEGQKMTFKTVTVYPTRIAVEVSYDENNSKQIFSFEDLGIVDESGEVLSKPSGLIARRIDTNTDILYLQSNYFNKPKELYLTLTTLEALDKDKVDVVIDLENKILLKKPDDRLSLNYIRRNGNELQFSFFLKKDAIIELHRQYFVFSGEIRDGDGNTFYSGGSGVSDGEEYQEVYINLPYKEYKGPITMKVSSYPSKITGEVNIKVK